MLRSLRYKTSMHFTINNPMFLNLWVRELSNKNNKFIVRIKSYFTINSFNPGAASKQNSPVSVPSIFKQVDWVPEKWSHLFTNACSLWKSSLLKSSDYSYNKEKVSTYAFALIFHFTQFKRLMFSRLNSKFLMTECNYRM